MEIKKANNEELLNAYDAYSESLKKLNKGWEAFEHRGNQIGQYQVALENYISSVNDLFEAYGLDNNQVKFKESYESTGSKLITRKNDVKVSDLEKFLVNGAKMLEDYPITMRQLHRERLLNYIEGINTSDIANNTEFKAIYSTGNEAKVSYLENAM